MNEKTKRLIKYLLLIALGAGILQVFYMFRSACDFMEGFSRTVIYSDYMSRYSIKEDIGRLPDSARHLYYARRGFQEYDTLIVFTINRSDCNAFLRRYTNISMDSFQHATGLPERVLRLVPESGEHSEAQDPDWWKLTKETESLVYNHERGIILYLPNESRLFIYIEGVI